MIQVVPAIIPNTREQMEGEIERVSSFAERVQIDISDGMFTSVKTWPYNGRDVDFFEDLKTEKAGWPKWDDLDFEVHLMVRNPEDVVLDWIHTGISSVVAHIEATNDFQKVIDICREYTVSVGVAIKPSANISKLEPFAEQVDFIQVMGSDELGRHGIELEEKAIEQIKSLHKLYPERIIAIDIGVNADTAETLVSAGVTKLISGGAILNSANPKEVFKYFESLGPVSYTHLTLPTIQLSV
jgi:ribulose-phosphate 3-epimerase